MTNKDEAVKGAESHHLAVCYDDEGKCECLCGLDDEMERRADAFEPPHTVDPPWYGVELADPYDPWSGRAEEEPF